MAMRTDRIVLDITYNDDEYPAPATWGWAELLDLPDRDHVRVIDANYVQTQFPGIKPAHYATLEDWARDSDYAEGPHGDWYQCDDDQKNQVDLEQCYFGAMEAADERVEFDEDLARLALSHEDSGCPSYE